MNWETPVSQLPLVGPVYAKRLKKLNLKTAADLLYHFPFRYLDYSLISSINRLQPGETVTVRGEVIQIKNEYTRGGKKIQKALIVDQTGQLEIIWFNQPFLVKTIKVGEGYNFSGKIDWFGKKKVMISPDYEIEHRGIHTGRLVPIYHETYGVSSKWLRSRISSLINQIGDFKDFLPKIILKKYQLLDLNQALKLIHFPEKQTEINPAKKRLAFEELFLLQLQAQQRKRLWQKQTTDYRIKINREKLAAFLKNLPFNLTLAQQRSLKQILVDLEKDQPMNRLLEGDVGSGKTVVAAATIYQIILNGYQTALMCPTEILAQQHFETLKQILGPMGVNIQLLTGSNKQKAKSNKFNLLIGTHALIYQRAKFDKLGLVIIDEQHRFGVEQRAKLINLKPRPHVLTMTATPIPRTIALSLYGDLDLSVIDQLPPGRQKVATFVVPNQKRQAAYSWIRNQVALGDQVFIICPLIEESETLTIKAATVEYQRLQKEIFPDLKLGLLHGRLKAKEKNQVMTDFRNQKINLLVATPVIEVGIDIPGATIILIEAADRFGLAQLHQLRGRVGRSSQKSYCLLFSDNQNAKAIKRLKALENNHVGIKLAEIDLQMRGPGQLYGTQQHGFWSLKMASFSDLELINQTKQAAKEILPQLNQLPLLRKQLKMDIILA